MVLMKFHRNGNCRVGVEFYKSIHRIWLDGSWSVYWCCPPLTYFSLVDQIWPEWIYKFVESQAALGTEPGFKVTLKALEELTETKCSKLLLEVRDNLNNNTVPLFPYLDVRILFYSTSQVSLTFFDFSLGAILWLLKSILVKFRWSAFSHFQYFFYYSHNSRWLFLNLEVILYFSTHNSRGHLMDNN
jgi:hypothetical protein